MALTDYQMNWGPRWRVKTITPGALGQLPADIATDDFLMFVGEGTSSSKGKLLNLTKSNLEWGVQCEHQSGDKVVMKGKDGLDWTITRTLPSGNRYHLFASASSGGGSWTADEG